jgi:hypothetical protein
MAACHPSVRVSAMKPFLVILSVVLGFCVAGGPFLVRPPQTRSPNDAASCLGQGAPCALADGR